MARAVFFKEMPEPPEGATGWRRSNRQGSMFHAHALGRAICGAEDNLERNASRMPANLGDMQFWGVCPSCFRKANKAALPPRAEQLAEARDILRMIQDRKWSTLTEGCNAASDAAKLARAFFGKWG